MSRKKKYKNDPFSKKSDMNAGNFVDDAGAPNVGGKVEEISLLDLAVKLKEEKLPPKDNLYGGLKEPVYKVGFGDNDFSDIEADFDEPVTSVGRALEKEEKRRGREREPGKWKEKIIFPEFDFSGVHEIDTDESVSILKDCSSAVLPALDYPVNEETDEIKYFKKHLKQEEYVEKLALFQKYVQEEQIKAVCAGREMSLDLKSRPEFEKLRNWENFLSRAITSDDPNTRAWAIKFKDETFRTASEQTNRDRIEKIKSLDPATLKKLADEKGVKAERCMRRMEQEARPFMRPDNMFGLLVLGSMLPPVALVALIPVILPAIAGIVEALSAVMKRKEAKLSGDRKNSLIKDSLANETAVNLLRSIRRLGEIKGADAGKILNAQQSAFARAVPLIREKIKNADFSDPRQTRYVLENLKKEISMITRPFMEQTASALKELPERTRLDYAEINVREPETGNLYFTTAEKDETTRLSLEKLNEHIRDLSPEGIKEYFCLEGKANERSSMNLTQARAVVLAFQNDKENALPEKDRERLLTHLALSCMPSDVRGINERIRVFDENGNVNKDGLHKLADSLWRQDGDTVSLRAEKAIYRTYSDYLEKGEINKENWDDLRTFLSGGKDSLDSVVNLSSRMADDRALELATTAREGLEDKVLKAPLFLDENKNVLKTADPGLPEMEKANKKQKDNFVPLEQEENFDPNKGKEQEQTRVEVTTPNATTPGMGDPKIDEAANKLKKKLNDEFAAADKTKTKITGRKR